MNASDWEKSHPWLSGVINGLIVAIFFGLSYAWTSGSAIRAFGFALLVGIGVATVRGTLLSRDRGKGSS